MCSLLCTIKHARMVYFHLSKAMDHVKTYILFSCIFLYILKRLLARPMDVFAATGSLFAAPI